MGKRTKEQIRESYLKVFSSDDGQIVLDDLCDFAKIMNGDYIEDPRKEAYWQGRRSVILEILKTIKGEEHEV